MFKTYDNQLGSVNFKCYKKKKKNKKNISDVKATVF